MASDGCAPDPVFDHTRVGGRTPVPPFDVDAFARELEAALHTTAATGERPSLPRPPLLPSSLEAPSTSRSPNRIREPLALRLFECAACAEDLSRAVRVGELSREEAARVARTELDSLDAVVARAGDEPLRAALTQLTALIEELGGIGDEAPTFRRGSSANGS
jgi:hypothetical protein